MPQPLKQGVISMALKSFADVQNFFGHINAAGAVHGPFWNTLSYDNFVTGTMPNVTDPNTNQKISDPDQG